MSSQACNRALVGGAAAPSDAPRAQTPTSGALPFIMGSMLLGTIGIFVHEAGAHPVTATWFRCAFGLLGLSVWMAIRGETSSLRLSPTNAAEVLAAAALMVIAWVLFFAAITLTSAGVASVLFHVQPLWVLVLARWFLKEKIAKDRLWAVLVAMIGLALATGAAGQLSSGASTPHNLGYWIGVAMCLLGAFCTACVTLIAKQVRETRTGVLAWWQCAIGAVALAGWPIVHGWPEAGMPWAWLAGLGVLHTGLAYSLMYTGIARLSTDRIAVLQFIYPGMVLLIDWLLYGRQLGPLQIAGVAIMAGAIWMAERQSRST